jgi:NADH dehydrogenase FAD-containing subunit
MNEKKKNRKQLPTNFEFFDFFVLFPRFARRKMSNTTPFLARKQRRAYERIEKNYREFVAMRARGMSTTPPHDAQRPIRVPAPRKERLVVLGTGWSSFALTRKIDARKFDVTVISDRNHFLFTPLLASCAVGTLEFRTTAESLRQARPDVNFHQAMCESIDAEKKQIVVRDVFSNRTFNYAFDKLVIGTGAQNETYGIPGVKENAYFLKNLADARLIRSKMIECLENASNPFLDDAERRRLCSFVIVGGGPTSVEIAGELSDFLRADAPKWFHDIAHLVTVTVIEASGELLASFDVALGRYARQSFRKRHIEVMTDARVTRVDPGKVTVSINGNERAISCSLIVWSTGIGPTPFLKSLPFEKHGWKLAVDEMLRLKSHPDIFAIGDCSHTNLPATAQAASQEGQFVANLLNGTLRGRLEIPLSTLFRARLHWRLRGTDRHWQSTSPRIHVLLDLAHRLFDNVCVMAQQAPDSDVLVFNILVWTRCESFLMKHLILY